MKTLLVIGIGLCWLSQVMSDPRWLLPLIILSGLYIVSLF